MPDFLKTIIIIGFINATSSLGDKFGGDWIGYAISGCGYVVAVVLAIAWYYDWKYEQEQMEKRLQDFDKRLPWR